MALLMKMPVQFLSVGQFVSPNAEWRHPARTLDNNVLILPCQGTAYLCEGGREYAVGVGSSIILRAGVAHAGYRPSVETARYYYMHFSYDADANGTRVPLFCDTAKTEQLFSMMHLLMHFNLSGEYAQQALDYQASLILMAIGAETAANPNQRIARIYAWLKLNACRNLSLHDIAREFGYNPDYLSRLFLKYSGLSIKDFLISERIASAKRMLMAGEESLKGIADHTGFSDVKYFIKVFKAKEGMTPGQYRKLHADVHLIDR